MLEHEPDGERNPYALRAVIDSCFFPNTKRWLTPLIDYARAGYLELIWSPLIIAEANRLLTWLWLKRNGGDQSNASWSRCSDAAKRMFSRLTQVFRVVDDCPPHEQLWTDRPADDWDVPIWTAAVRAEAGFVVTANLEDGPPEGPDGLREHNGIVFMDLDDFLGFVAFYVDRVASITTPSSLPELEGEAPSEAEVPEVYHDLLRELPKGFPE
jgi:hypothetical protein